MRGYEAWADRNEVFGSLAAIGDDAEWHCIPASETLENRAYFLAFPCLWRSPKILGRRVTRVGKPVGKAGCADLAQFVGRLAALPVTKAERPGIATDGAVLYLNGGAKVAKSFLSAAKSARSSRLVSSIICSTL
jgi:hypothetical protein